MYKFTSIEQFRNVIKNVKQLTSYVGKDDAGDNIYDYNRTLPVIDFEGTVKLHGTNAGIVFNMDTREITYQSRERVLSLTQDNATFMLTMMGKEKLWNNIFDSVWVPNGTRKIVVYGEWCGQGIQKGVAVSELPKMFVVFGLKVIEDENKSQWLDVSTYSEFSQPENNIYNIYDFPTYKITIDFTKPEEAQNELIKITEAVEAECPVAYQLGVSGIGEGVVWAPVNPVGWWKHKSDLTFKVKGEKHSVSKVKTLAPIDVEAVQKASDFINSVVTEARLEQGLDNLVREQLKPFEMQSLGEFIRWVYNDIIKEEVDTIVANGFDPKKLGGPVANKARLWYINKFNAEG